MTTQAAKPTFEDRYTMRHVREYPHPIEAVFDAVTNTEAINAWLLPIADVEPRLGGRCSFTWGGPPGTAMEGTVAEFDPPNLVHYDLLGSFLRFELEALGPDRTRLVFRHRIERVGVDTLTLWPPDVVHGFDDMIDKIGDVLDGTRDQDEVRAVRSACEAGTIREWIKGRPEAFQAEVERRIGTFREHILANCPSEDPSIASGAAPQPTAFEAAIRGSSDEEIAAWAERNGGLEAVCGVVLAEMRNRLQPSGSLAIAYDLGFGTPWMFTVDGGSVELGRSQPDSTVTRVEITPQDFLRIIVNDLDANVALSDGRVTVEGDQAVLYKFFAMTPRGRGAA